MSNVSQKYLTDENNNKFSPVASTDSVYGDGVGGGNALLIY